MMNIYPEGKGTASNPIEIFGVVGKPTVESCPDGTSVLGVNIYRTWDEFPWEEQVGLEPGEVAALVFIDHEPDGSGRRYQIVGAAELDESCYAQPGRRGGLRILNPERAAHMAYFILGVVGSEAGPPDLDVYFGLPREIEYDYLDQKMGALPL